MTRTYHRRVVFALIVVTLLVSIAAVVTAAAASGGRRRPAPAGPDSIVTLTSGEAVERALGAGEEHAFQVSIAQDEVLRIAVEQQGVDVGVALQFGREAPVTIDDETTHRYGRALSVWRAPADGAVRLTVRGAPTVVPSGRYRLTITILPPSDGLALAMTTSAEAVSLSRETQGTNAEAAVRKLGEAVDAWRAYGDRELLAKSLSRLGRFQKRPLNRPVDCAASLTEALALYEALAQPSEIAATLIELGDAQILTGAREEARATYERAYTYADAIDPVDRGIIEDDLAKASTFLGDFDRGVMFGQRAIATFRAAGARRDEFLALERLAQTYQRMRLFDEALGAATEAIPLARKYGRDDDLAALMRTLGMIQLASGDDDTALVTFRAALDLFKGQTPVRVATMLSIGRVYNEIGDAQRAREWLEQTLAVVPAQLRDYWAAAASELGRSLTLLGEPARALDLQRKALDIVTGRSAIGELSMLPDLAVTCRALGDIDCARKATARAGEVAETFPGHPYGAIVLRERARDARAAGDLPLARQHLDAALEIIESDRGRLQSQALRASFGGLSGVYYDEAIDLAMRMHAAAPGAGHDARALELFERSRARGLSDLLDEARQDIRAGVDPTLLARQRALQTQLGVKDTALRDLAGKPAAAARAPILEREIDDITRRLAVLDAEIREASPRYAALRHPRPLSATEIQQLLDHDTVWLALSPGSARIQPGRVQTGWGWAVTRDTLRGFPLAASGRIEEAARKVYDGLAARQRYVAADGPERLARIDRDLAVDAAALSDLVLGPIAGALHGEWRTRRLAIVATGPLEYIPFAALPAPAVAPITPPTAAGPEDTATAMPADTAIATAAPSAIATPREWLVSTHELVQLPSASVLARLREDAARRGPATRAVAVVADPVYAADDPRVQTKTGIHAETGIETPTRGQDDLFRGLAQDRPRSGFSRLVFSREEAGVITKLAAGRGVLEALDFRASLATMRGPAVAGARIVHIASHGIFNSARPELSGLVLSLVDQAGRPREGVLRLHDVYNLKLAADLVVLSGCETGLGRQMKSEGVVGLARGFMYAGAPRVVASLWKVDDLATAELMRRFYRGMLVRKLSPAAALRAAQDEMRTSTRWRAPYYWAAFTLIGDWR